MRESTTTNYYEAECVVTCGETVLIPLDFAFGPVEYPVRAYAQLVRASLTVPRVYVPPPPCAALARRYAWPAALDAWRGAR